jgi:hypothetical protein
MRSLGNNLPQIIKIRENAEKPTKFKGNMNAGVGSYMVQM